MTEEWGPWIEHDGKGCPVQDDMFLRVRWQDDLAVRQDECWAQEILAEAWDWSFFGQPDLNGDYVGRILAYQIRRPRALQQLIDLVENLPAPERERVPEEAGA